ncbi:Aspartate/glutamate leucyltransferase [Emticicia aquatica]|uniref:Aspartate/glutamate leucyltransferase n=1 Tax=Emticicia aquatica TaxID=1681835 RepID=A0ABN8EPI4_9BACT|nr:arginyl-tRNA--protein arginylyltransferase [Emticicia aquatica]CAH0994560.1 Aspartate/glutamate leucyltransferase [Emticicia aquatica]
MFVELHYPESLTAQELDICLANGWFRMGQSIFTTNFLRFQDIIYSSIWLRIGLLNLQESNFQKKISKQNAKFKVIIQPAKPSVEHEMLFSKYREKMTFEPAPTVYNLLYGQKEERASLQLFNTFEINIYDQNRLIAVGFFDLGKDSAAGISCFYDPEYKKYSLGKYLMYLKMDFCKKSGCKFFYPGYFAPGYRLFDYKLDLAKPTLEYLDLVTDEWRPFEEYDSTKAPFDVMCLKLRELAKSLDKRNVKNQFKYYDFFDADMISNLNGLGLFDFPACIFCFEFKESETLIPMVVFDVRDNQFHLIVCSKVYKSIFEESPVEHYNTYLLQLTRYLYTGESVDEMTDVIEMYGRELMNI